MTSLVDVKMLETKIVTEASLVGDNLVVKYSDGTTQNLNMTTMPALAQIASMVTKIAAINAYISAHP